MSAVMIGRVVAVSDVLAERKATIRELVAATGYSRSSVESAIAVLRRQRATEVLANLMRDRKGPLPKVPSQPSAIAVALRDRREEQDPTRIVPTALASRSLLEQAWGAWP